MEFNDFVAVLAQWFEARTPTPLDGWIDEANARLTLVEGGIRCSIDVLDPYDASAPERLQGILGQGAVCVACHCDGALAIDPDTQCLVLVHWLAPLCTCEQLLALLQNLANQREALLSLMHNSPFAPASGQPRSVLAPWHLGV